MHEATWEGQFGWQDHVVSGRPDLLNYIYHRDVTWKQVWQFCRQEPAPPDALQRLRSLFHGYLSTLYDREGCWLDPDGEVYRELRAWATFALDTGGAFAEDQVIETLGILLDDGIISHLYFAAAYAIYTEATLDRYAARWSTDRTEVLALAAGDGATEGASRTMVEVRALPAYRPDGERFEQLHGDPEWERCLERLLDRHYHSWNQVYVATAPDEDLADSLQDTGGEG